MIKSTLDMLGYTPFIFLINGYWMLSNKQIFSNVVNQKSFSTEQMLSGHKLDTVWEFSQATPCLAVAVAIFTLATVRALCKNKVKEWGFEI